MTPLINTLIGPVAAVAAFLYARTAYLSWKVRDSAVSVGGLALATFVLTYLALFRLLRLAGLITPGQAADFIFAMGIPVYGVHCYVALRLGQSCLLRGRLRMEQARQRRVVADLLDQYPKDDE